MEFVRRTVSIVIAWEVSPPLMHDTGTVGHGVVYKASGLHLILAANITQLSHYQRFVPYVSNAYVELDCTNRAHVTHTPHYYSVGVDKM